MTDAERALLLEVAQAVTVLADAVLLGGYDNMDLHRQILENVSAAYKKVDPDFRDAAVQLGTP